MTYLPHRERCECPDYTTTLHAGAALCPRRGLPSAVCWECGGCKYCRMRTETARSDLWLMEEMSQQALRREFQRAERALRTEIPP